MLCDHFKAKFRSPSLGITECVLLSNDQFGFQLVAANSVATSLLRTLLLGPDVEFLLVSASVSKVGRSVTPLKPPDFIICVIIIGAHILNDC